MKHALSPEARQRLEALLAQPTLLAFDFDGTLAAIVDDPGTAAVTPAVAAVLARLAQRLPVAIVTGRCVDDVRDRLGFEPRWIIGSHGAEDPESPPSGSNHRWLAPLRKPLQQLLASPRGRGMVLEDKGHSLALHYRHAPDRSRALDAIEAMLARQPPGLRSFGGKCVVNVVPENAPDKGDAVASLMRRAGVGQVVYLGDDLNDEAVFERAGPGWFTVRVEPGEGGSAAAFWLETQLEVVLMLQFIEALTAG